MKSVTHPALGFRYLLRNAHAQIGGYLQDGKDDPESPYVFAEPARPFGSQDYVIDCRVTDRQGNPRPDFPTSIPVRTEDLFLTAPIKPDGTPLVDGLPSGLPRWMLRLAESEDRQLDESEGYFWSFSPECSMTSEDLPDDLNPPLVSFLSDGVAITNPYVSDCGRFDCKPSKQYGVSEQLGKAILTENETRMLYVKTVVLPMREAPAPRP